ncbi:MAG: DsbA family protein [Alphaproteobacteria bacterium]
MWNKSFIIIVLASFALSCVALWRASVGPSSERLMETILEEFNKKPEVIAEITVQGMRNLQQKAENADLVRKQKKIKEKQAELETNSVSPFIGNPNGDMVITQFFDYHCGYCRKVDPIIEELLKTDHSVRIVFKEYPIFGDATLAKAALAANKQKKYKEFHTSLMNAEANLSEDSLVGLARSLGMDGAKFVKDMNSPAIEKELKDNLALGESLEISGTPCFIIGGTLLPGAIDLETIKKTLASERLKKTNAPK